METVTPAKTKPTPAPVAPPTGQRAAIWYCLAAALGSSVLLWMCFQPLSWGAYLGWVALVPFFILVRSQARPLFVYNLAFLCGLAFFVPALSWMRVADKAMAMAWLTLSVYCGLFFVYALFCIRCLERWKLPLVVSAPLVWVGFEWVRCWALTGFPWYLLAHTQHDLLVMIQITDIGGVFLVSFVVVAVNAFLFDCLYQVPEIRKWFNQTELEPYRYYASAEILNRGVFAEFLFRRNLILEGLCLAALLGATYAYGEFRLGQNRFGTGPTVCLLQSNLDQRLRESNSDRSLDVMKEHFSKLIVRAALNHKPSPDLVIWPETSYTRPWVEVSKELPAEKVPDKWRDAVIDVKRELDDVVGKYTRVPHLLGMNTHFLDADGRHRRYNSALLVKPLTTTDREGRPVLMADFAGKFDKVHRVPFGEFLPLGDWLPFLSVLTPYEGADWGIQAGDKLTRFELGKYHFGVLICYEDTDPFMARRYLDDSGDQPAIDFIVNISNDGWFDGSSEHEEHLAVSRFRAIECRRAMVRSVNMGVSALIDGNGRVLMPKVHPAAKDPPAPVWIIQEGKYGEPVELPVSQWHEFKRTSGILKATVPIDGRFSFYAVAGDWLPIGCWAVLLGGAAWALCRRRMAVKAA
jgi:apolipoprotein N-acyltransferase